jgi:hypothetical protein
MLHLLRAAALAGAVVLCAAAADAPAVAPPAPSPPAAPATPQAAAPAERLEEVDENQVVALLGLAVNAADAKEVGRIVDVLVDGHGRPRAAVLDVGGFLGVGNRKVAVAWEAVRFSLGKTPAAMLSVTSDRLKAAPAYDAAKPVEAVEAPPPPPPPKSTAPAAPGAAEPPPPKGP